MTTNKAPQSKEEQKVILDQAMFDLNEAYTRIRRIERDLGPVSKLAEGAENFMAKALDKMLDAKTEIRATS